MRDASEIHVYTDGSCHGAPGPMGIGVCIEYHGEDGHPWTLRYGSYIGEGTNNQAELFAIARGLVLVQTLPRAKECSIKLYSDSQYAIGVLTKNWQPEKNLDLIAYVKKLIPSNVEFIHVKGHAGNRGNTIVDKIAGYCQKNRLTLSKDELTSALTSFP